MKNVIYREIMPEEYELLEEFLYHAIHRRAGEPEIPRDIVNNPELQIYYKNFGSRSDDYCVVADCRGEILGAAWVRLLANEPKGFGNIDDTTPEFAVAVLAEHRGAGIGRKLMNVLIDLLAEKNYKQASLAVQKDNRAYNLYKDIGFEFYAEKDEEYLMIYRFE